MPKQHKRQPTPQRPTPRTGVNSRLPQTSPKAWMPATEVFWNSSTWMWLATNKHIEEGMGHVCDVSTSTTLISRARGV